MEVWASAMVQLAPALALVMALLLSARSRHAPELLLVVGGLFLMDSLLLSIHAWAAWIEFIPGKWNWEGKLAALALTLAAIAVLPAGLRDQIGLFRAPERRRVVFGIGVLICALAFARTYYFGEAEPRSLETLAYQASLPGLQEELAFRGLWWVLLAAVLDPDRIRAGQLPWRTLAVSSALFASVHAVHLSPAGGLNVEWPYLVATLVSGVLYGLVQGLGRSIWVTVLVHNLANLIIVIWQMG